MSTKHPKKDFSLLNERVKSKSWLEQGFMILCFCGFCFLIVIISYKSILASKVYGSTSVKKEKMVKNASLKREKGNISKQKTDLNTTKDSDLNKKPASQNKQENPFKWAKLFTKLRVVENDHVDYFVKLYTGKQKEVLMGALKRMQFYWPTVLKYAKKYKLPLELAILGIIESEYNPKARSNKGALGIWQLMPRTARILGLKSRERTNVEKSTKAAFCFLRGLTLRYHGNWPFVFAAYNSGGTYIHKMIRIHKMWDFWKLYRIPGFKKETYHYVPKFYAILYILKNEDKYFLVKKAKLKNTKASKKAVQKAVKVKKRLNQKKNKN